jgi:hypothetical protein
MAAPEIFISYSHEDEEWKERLRSQLRASERRGAVTLWDTSALTPGVDWSPEIEKAVRQSDIAVLLISPSYLASDYVMAKELPALLERRERDGLAVVPVLLSHSLWSGLPGIAQLKFANDPARPLASLSRVEQDNEVAKIAQQIATLAEAVAQRSTSTMSPEGSGPVQTAKRQIGAGAPLGEGAFLFVSHSKDDGDFAELLKLKLEREGHTAWVDTDRLSPGLDWRLEIDEGIKNAKALIAIMSPPARTSEYVTYEWAFAWGCGKKLIPIMLRETTLHPRLATLQYLDFTNRLARPWMRLLEVLSDTSDKILK